jgi:SAM-dependent methyltransferase
VSDLYDEHAELYDIAFDWDVEEEVDWLLERLGRDCGSVLEPGCGTGRMLVALARRGIEAVGFDLSEAALAIARRRLAPFGELVAVTVGDMADFDLGRSFGGAICPINTLGHLTPQQLEAHLVCMARHLDPRARYLVQVGLVDSGEHEPFAGSHWEASRGETKLRIDWIDEELDVESGRSLQRSRIEVLEGPRAGEVLEEVHEMTAWTPETWTRAVAASPFSRAATYDAGRRGARPLVGSEATGGLLWHELVAERA